ARRARGQLPPAHDVPVPGIRRARRLDVLRGQLRRALSPSGDLVSKHIKGRKAGPPADRGADDFRAGDQRRHGDEAAHHPRARTAAAGRPAHRMTATVLEPSDFLGGRGVDGPSSMIHTAGPPRTSPETRRSTQRPSDELPTSLPCSTMTLPRRIVVTGYSSQETP